MGLSSLLGGAASLFAGKSEGDLAWSRQKRMMQNRHQWEVADLKAAGLNPILSAGGAPSMASPQAAKLPDLQQTSSTARQSTQDKATRKVMSLQGEKLKAETWLTHSANQKVNTEQALLAFQLPAARIAMDIAESPSGRAAAASQVWVPHVTAGASGLRAIMGAAKGGGSP